MTRQTPLQPHRLLLTILVAAVSACAHQTSIPSEADVPITLGSAGPLDPRAIAIDTPPEAVFRPWGRESDDRLTITRSTPAGSPTQWATSRRLARGSISEETVEVTPAGDLAIATQSNHRERVLVEFEPPLVVVPAGLKAGSEPFAQDLSMVVHPIDNRRQVRAKGKARNEIVYQGVQRLETPAGTFDNARKLTSTLTADLPPSKVRNVTEQWFVDGIGLVAERRTERTEVMGLAVRNNAEAWWLAEAPATR